MKNKEFYKLLKKNQANSGFTLIELLVGLVMSIFVIGALGFGLMTVLQTNQRENSKVKARTENSRALDFISDEVRRARNIETDTTINAPRFPASLDKTVVLALDIPEISDSGTMDSDKNADTKNERIVYYLSSNNGSNWKGPQVLYRWGPLLDANGKYVDDLGVLWESQALIDGINTTPVTNPCSTGTVSTVNPTGFYACISLQDPTKVYDPNSLIQDPLDPSKNIQNPNYNPRNTAQLFLTGQTKTATGVNENQTNDTQVVARARTAAANSTDKNSSVSWSVKGLGGKFSCNGTDNWDMRTDFGNDPSNPDNTIKWIQDAFVARQPQPIPINPGVPLAITSSAVGKTGCANDDRGNPGTNNQNELLSKYNKKISHTIDFGNPVTYNGDEENGTYNNPKVKGLDEAVQFFKKGYQIPTQYAGYDLNGNGVFDAGDQPSLGKFLYDQGLAIPLNGGDPKSVTTEFKIPTSDSEIAAFLASSSLTPSEKLKFQLLGDDERIIAVEVGQISSTQNNDGTRSPNDKNPGFDLQDNIFIVTSDVFKKKFKSECFGGSGCP
ncbi:MAG: hypothetical protein RLZZ04_4529 [Cyanobacteriota bacterium]|jgi:type II secretory pathway pseudopilin PulG